jgi:predicted HTH domain antitoxin
MATMTHEILLSAFAALHLSPTELAREMRIAACAQWYAQGSISQERAAEIAGLSRIEFLEELFRCKVPARCERADRRVVVREIGAKPEGEGRLALSGARVEAGGQARLAADRPMY